MSPRAISTTVEGGGLGPEPASPIHACPPTRAPRRGDRVLAAIATLQPPTGPERNLGEYVERVAAAACDALDYRVCLVYLYDSRDDAYYAEATYGVSAEERDALLATPVPMRVALRLMAESYRLDWSFYVPVVAPVWDDPEVSACFTMSATLRAAWRPGWQPGDLFLVPLELNEGDPIGFLIVDEPIDGRLPDPETLLGIATLARSCANTIESVHLYKTSSEEAAISSALLQVAEAVGTPDQALLFSRTSAILSGLLGADHCAVWHVDDGAAALCPVVDAPRWVDCLAAVWEGEIGLRAMLERGDPLAVEEPDGDGAGAIVAALGLTSGLLIPLFLHDACAGAIVVGWASPAPAPGVPHRFRARELDIARGVSRLVGVALQNARLYRDTTRQAERNAQLYERERDAVRRLRELDELRNDFVSTVSHELRTPLTGIKGFTDTLLNYWERMPDARRIEMVGKVNNAANRLERLVHDLLFVSRVESGGLPLHLTTTALEPLVAEAVQEIEGKYPGQEIQARSPRPARPARSIDGVIAVTADPDRVRQVIVNLLDNAAKYSVEGRPIRVRWTRRGGVARVTVVDRGPGIAPADLSRLFTRFGKLDSVPRAGHVGTGLGLYIARSLVEAMGGAIGVRSRPRLGTAFSFTLPLATSD